MEARDQDLLNALKSLAEEKRKVRVTHAYRVVTRFELPIRTKAKVDRFLAWMMAEDLAASTQSTILSTIRSVQPGNQTQRLAQVKVPARSVQEQILGREEIKTLLDHLRCNEEWFTPALPCG